MARLEFNLWDMHEIRIAENEIVIDTADTQVHLILPLIKEGLELPEYNWKEEIKEELPEAIQEMVVCTHPAIMHRLGGGCNATGCLCEGTRLESECERVTN